MADSTSCTCCASANRTSEHAWLELDPGFCFGELPTRSLSQRHRRRRAEGPPERGARRAPTTRSSFYSSCTLQSRRWSVDSRPRSAARSTRGATKRPATPEGPLFFAGDFNERTAYAQGPQPCFGTLDTKPGFAAIASHRTKRPSTGSSRVQQRLQVISSRLRLAGRLALDRKKGEGPSERQKDPRECHSSNARAPRA